MSESGAKGSFILHRDTLSILNEMNNEQAGVLFKSIFHYQTTGELPDLDFGMKMALSPFIAQFIRDSIRYEKAVTNGSKGGRPKLTSDNPSKPKLTSDNLKEPKITQDNLNKPNLTYSDSVSVSVSDSVSVSKKKSKVLTPVVCTSAHDTILKWYNHIFKTNVRKIGTEDRKRLDKYIGEYDVDGCIEILLGVTQDAWMMGEDAKNSTKYIGWGNIFKLNEDNFSRFSTKYHAATSNGAKWVKDITSPVGVSWWSQEHFSMSTAPDTHPWRVIQEPDIFTTGLLNDKFEYVWTEDEIKIYTEHLESQRADKIATQEAVLEGYQNPDDDTLPDSWVIGDLEPVEDIAPWVDTNTPEPVF